MAYEFTPPEEFKGKQIVIDSDRVINHSRKDTLNVSQDAIVNSTKEFHVNSSDVTKINSPQTFIGEHKDGNTPNNPAVKGAETVEIMQDLIEILIQFLETTYPTTTTISAAPGSPSAPNVAANKTLADVQVKLLNELNGRLEDLQSKNIFIS